MPKSLYSEIPINICRILFGRYLHRAQRHKVNMLKVCSKQLLIQSTNALWKFLTGIKMNESMISTLGFFRVIQIGR